MGGCLRPNHRCWMNKSNDTLMARENGNASDFTRRVQQLRDEIRKPRESKGKPVLEET